jgi:hypothetical protein
MNYKGLIFMKILFLTRGRSNMKKLGGIYFITVLILSFCFSLSPLAQEKKEVENVYAIKQGDTLWDISSKFLKDPFLWPKLWQRNPYITNPHWIYPGQLIRLSPPEDLKKVEETRPREGPPKVVVEEKRKEEEPKKVVVEEKPKEVAVVEKPKEAVAEAEVKKVEAPPIKKKVEVVAEAKPVERKREVFPEVKSAGFLSDIKFRGIGIILDSKEGKNLMAQGDIVYLAFKTSKPIMVGDKYTVFRVSEVVRHPATSQEMGRKYNIIGNVQVIDQYGNFFTARVIEAFDGILIGDMIQPYVKEKMEAEERK